MKKWSCRARTSYFHFEISWPFADRREVFWLMNSSCQSANFDYDKVWYVVDYKISINICSSFSFYPWSHSFFLRFSFLMCAKNKQIKSCPHKAGSIHHEYEKFLRRICRTVFISVACKWHEIKSKYCGMGWKSLWTL